MGPLALPRPHPTPSGEWTQKSPQSMQGGLNLQGQEVKWQSHMDHRSRQPTRGRRESIQHVCVRERERKQTHVHQLHLRTTSASDLRPFQTTQTSPSPHRSKTSFPRATKAPKSLSPPDSIFGRKGRGAMVNTECMSIYQNELLKNRGGCFNQEHLDRIYWQIKFFPPHPLLSLPTFCLCVRSSRRSHQLLKRKLLFFAHIKSGMNFFLTLPHNL